MTESQDAFAELLATLREVGDRFAGEEWGLTDPTDVAEGLRVDPPPPGHRHRDPARGRRGPPDVPRDRVAVAQGARRQRRRPLPRRQGPPRRHLPGAGPHRRARCTCRSPSRPGAEDGAFPSGTVGVLNDTGFDVDARRLVRDHGRRPAAGPRAGCRSHPTPRGSRCATTGSRPTSPQAPPVADLALTIDLVDGADDVPAAPPAPTDASVAASIRRMAHLRPHAARSTPSPSRARASRRRSCRASRTSSRRRSHRAPTRWPRPTPPTAWRRTCSGPTTRS